MNPQSSTGSGGVSDDKFDAILHRLDALDAKMNNLLSVQEEVVALKETMKEHGAQQAALESTPNRVDTTHRQQHQALNVMINHVEVAHSAPGGGCPPPWGRRGTTDEEDDDASNDFLPIAHKLKFPKFDGTGDPLLWLNRCKQYFHICRTPEQKHVTSVAFYLLVDAQLWFHRMELNSGRPTWPQFVQLVNARFEPPLTDSPIGELAMLWRSGTVDDFCKLFIALSCRDVSLTEA
jgi:hypothetical protein